MLSHRAKPVESAVSSLETAPWAYVGHLHRWCGRQRISQQRISDSMYVAPYMYRLCAFPRWIGLACSHKYKSECNITRNKRPNNTLLCRNPMKSGQLTYGLGVLLVPAARRRLDLSHFCETPTTSTGHIQRRCLYG